MSFFPHYAPFFLFSAPSKWNVFLRITEIGAHKLRLHAPFTMDIIKGRLLFDAFSDVFMSCICFADTVNICGNKHIFIVIVIVIVKENVWISLKFVPTNMPALVQIMAWCQPGDKPLSEPMMIRLLMHICVTQPQWFNTLHWDVMVAIFQTPLSNAFTWQKMFEFWTGAKPLPQPMIIQFNGI